MANAHRKLVLTAKVLFFLLVSFLLCACQAGYGNASTVAHLSSVPSGRRSALVIGNGAYSPAYGKLRPLPDAVNDAKQVGTVLRQLDFDIAHGAPYENLTLVEMNTAITSFINELKAGDVGLVYYSGHGNQAGIDNYLLPVDFGVENDDVGTAGVPLEDSIITPMADRNTSANIILLDACRDIVGTKSGLTKPSSIPNDTYIMYAVQPNFLAPSPSPFTEPLLANIREPGLRIEDLFSRVRKDVLKKTNNAIRPTAFGQISPAFFFREQAYIEVTIANADDDLKIRVNGKTAVAWQTNGTTPQKIFLNSGANDLEIRVYNQRTFTGGIEALGGHQPEGWSYSVNFRNSNGTDLTSFQGGEDKPVKDGPHHGKEFTVIKASLVVDNITGEIKVSGVEKLA
jgi:hypothetical protein